MLFPPKHPYFKAPEKAKQIIDEIKDRREENFKLYQKLKNDPDYFDVEYDHISGGVKAIHKDHNFDTTKGIFNIPRGEYERNAVKALFRKGYSIILKSEVAPAGEKCPDGYLNEVLMDIKGIEHGNPLYAMKRANEQEVKTVVLYYHDKTDYKRDVVKLKFETLPEWINKQNYIKDKTIHLKKIVCVIRHNNNSYDVEEI